MRGTELEDAGPPPPFPITILMIPLALESRTPIGEFDSIVILNA